MKPLSLPPAHHLLHALQKQRGPRRHALLACSSQLRIHTHKRMQEEEEAPPPATMARSKTKIPLKLLYDNKTNKVLFAEAGQDFVDFVFSLLTLPVGAVAKLVSASAGATMPHGTCSVGRLYKSVDDMAAAYFLPSADKSELLQPRAPQPDGRDLLEQLRARFNLYTCLRWCMLVTVDDWADCPRCRRPMAYVLPTAAPMGDGGYVKGGLVTYMVTEGLEVTPMSAISSVTLINRFCVGKDVDLAEKYVAVDMDEGLPLLKAALLSDTVLSDFFLARTK